MFPGYALVAQKSGLKVHAVEPGKPSLSTHNGHMTAEKASMANLAANLSRRLAAPVDDATGLTSVFDFELDLPERSRAALSGDAGATDAPDPGSYEAALAHVLEDRLGLKLEARKVPVEVLVIDRAEKPAEN
jgi:uncharacterized protein (TIGR03435 family)